MTEFFDLAQADRASADHWVLSFPFEGSVSYGTGTAAGPAAVCSASLHLESFEEETGIELADELKIAALDPLEPKAQETTDEYAKRTRAFVSSLEPGDRFLLSLGGEHSITPNVMAGAYADCSEITVVQIDAHADLRQDYDGSIHNHACAMRRVLDLGVRQLHAIAIRSATREEAALSRENPRIRTWWAHELAARSHFHRMLEALRSLKGPVYLTIDVDGLEVTLCPGTGTPQPGGLSWHETMALLRALIWEGEADLIGADIMETSPQPNSRVNEMVAAKLCSKIVGYRLARKLSIPRPE